jgi:hypothetical protein
MHRYATYVELAGGLVLLYLLARLWRSAGESARGFNYGRAAFALLALVLFAQAASACVYAYRFEWGGRPAFFRNPLGHLREARHLLRDRSPLRFLSTDERALLEGVDVWAQSGPLTAGYQLTLRPDAPQWCLYMTEFFTTEEARRRFARAVEEARGKRVFTLVLDAHYQDSLETVRAAGLGVGRVRALNLPFYTERGRFHTASLVEVLPPAQAAGGRPALTAAAGPLTPDAFKAALRWTEPPPAAARAGEVFNVRVRVRNESTARWPALGDANHKFRLYVGNHWLDGAGRVLVNDDGRAPLPHDLAHGAEADVTLAVSAPRAPGEYVLEIDLLQESVTWFGLKGSPTLKQKVTVRP